MCGQSSPFTLIGSDFIDKCQLPFSPPTPSKPTADTFQLAFAVPEEWGGASIFLARFGVHPPARRSLREG